MNGTTGAMDARTAGNADGGVAAQRRPHRLRLWVNWILALLTVPVAAVVLIFGLGAVMSTSGCSNRACEGPSGLVFAFLFYGAPAVAALAIVVSFFTARRRWGVAVPICALALLAADVAVMALSFRT